MFTLAGLRTTHTGEILLDGQSLVGLPAYERVGRGLVLVPERRRLFPFMTVLENLEIGAYSASGRARSRDKAWTTCWRCCRCWPSGASRWPARSPAASSRCWRSAAR